MSDVIIKAENLGKKYIIGHQVQNGRYVALRDVVMHNAKMLWSKTKDLVKGNQIIQGDTTEEIWALKDLNFEIKRGEAVGIIGRNGAGKSTLLKILSRITEPTTGRVTIKGRVASLLEVGTGFHPELTGRENIYLNGTILGMTRLEIKKKFDEIVAFAEIEKFLDTPVKRYSSGMYVRLAFAVAAHLEPEILVVDEVLAVGDAQFQKKCLGKMYEVSKLGRTVLFVSHNMAAISELCDKGILLKSGNIALNDNIVAVVNKYMMRSIDDKIISNINYYNEKIKILKIEINGSEKSDIYLKTNDNIIKIIIYGQSYVESKISVEGKLYDIRGNAIAVYSPGHLKLDILKIGIGEFVLTANIELPDMTKGEYILDICLLNPGYEFYCIVNSAITINKESMPFKSCLGGVYESRLGHGSIILGGSIKLGI